MILFGQDGCFAKIRVCKEYTEVNHDLLRGQDKNISHSQDVKGIARDSSCDKDLWSCFTDPGCIPPIWDKIIPPLHASTM